MERKNRLPINFFVMNPVPEKCHLGGLLPGHYFITESAQDVVFQVLEAETEAERVAANALTDHVRVVMAYGQSGSYSAGRVYRFHRRYEVNQVTVQREPVFAFPAQEELS